jgi:FkbM family methyltransferase
MIEPDPNNLAVGQRHFEINGATGRFVNASVGRHSAPPEPFVCEGDGVTREIPCVCVDDLVQQENIDRLELLLVDTQGAEIAALEGAVHTIEAGKLRFVVISTHHHSISHDPIIRQRCLAVLRGRKAHIITEHSVAELYSGDGLIVASFLDSD